MRRRRWLSAMAVVAGAALLAALLWAAHPAQILALARRTSGEALALGFGWATIVLALRGARLSLLSGGRLSLARATAVIAAAQLPTTVLPMRFGELAFLPALRAAGVTGAVRGLSFLVLTRVLDVGGLLLWAVGVGIWMRVPGLLAAASVAAAVALTGYLVLRSTRSAHRLALRLRHGGAWRRRLLRQLLEVRHELLRVSRSPWRAAMLGVCSLAIWGGIWQVTVVLMRGMSLAWPARSILLGVIGAALGASLPLNAVGTFGTQEAGWAAALATVGVAAKEALAAGFASHTWSIAFAGIHCLLALPWLVAWQRRPHLLA